MTGRKKNVFARPFEWEWFECLAYRAAWERQQRRVEAILAGEADNLLLVLEHPPVYTIGRSGRRAEVLDARIPVVATDRGGKVTYHGPGQMVAYVVCDLRTHPMGVRAHVDRLEGAVLLTLAGLGIKGEIERENPGVWVNGEKIAALGVRIRRGIAYHGVSLNRNPDMAAFRGIVPCGLAGRPITSLARMGVKIDRAALEARFRVAFSTVFAVQWSVNGSLTQDHAHQDQAGDSR